jgi:hypothetical protein
LIEFSAFPVREKQGMLILMRSPQGRYLDMPIPQPVDDTVRMSVVMGCIFVQYISPVVTKISILVQANATIDPISLPEWLLNFGKKQIMHFLMDSLRSTIESFSGSEYETRVAQNSDFYEFIKNVLREQVHID